jgi:hypothetical protein
MRYGIILSILALLCTLGCHTSSPFVDVGIGYTRFEIDDIVSKSTVNSQTATTKLQHADAFIIKTRWGGSPIESVPQLKGGVEIRGALGGAYDSKNVDEDRKAYSELLLLLLGAGPFISWRQPLGKSWYVEGGSFISGYTVGVHERGYYKRLDEYDGYPSKQRRVYYDEESTGGLGWSGGFFGKIGIVDVLKKTTSLALEFSYEAGKWDFGGDIGKKDAKNLSFLFSANVEF